MSLNREVYAQGVYLSMLQCRHRRRRLAAKSDELLKLPPFEGLRPGCHFAVWLARHCESGGERWPIKQDHETPSETRGHGASTGMLRYTTVLLGL